jgi:hypothetical protein
MKEAAKLRDLIKAGQQKERFQRCITCDYLRTLSLEDQQAIHEAIDSKHWSVYGLWSLLTDQGYQGSASAFRSHFVNRHQR